MPARPPKSLRHMALDCLARREYSRKELFDRLQQRQPEASPEAINDVLDQLQHDGLQDDARFAFGYTRLRVMRGHGPRKIAYELQQKGVVSRLVALALADHDWHSLAQAALHKKFGESLDATWEERAKQLRFLQQRGFDPHEL